MKRRYFLAVFIFVLAGFALLAYPTVSNWLAEKNQTVLVEQYAEVTESLTVIKRKEELQKAYDYNAALNGTAIEDPFVPRTGVVLPENYTSILNIHGVMGYIEIPKISQRLPIFHGTSTSVLEEGVGHLDATAFPVGGEGTHAVLTGHRGLPTAKIFTDLDQMVEGDTFYVYVLDEVFAYEVDQILVVTPDDTTALRPVEGKDLLTLVTCTPYSINSHRMLVRGHRIPYIPPEEGGDLQVFKQAVNWRMILIVGFFIVFFIVFVIWLLHGRKQRKKAKRRRNETKT